VEKDYILNSEAKTLADLLKIPPKRGFSSAKKGELEGRERKRGGRESKRVMKTPDTIQRGRERGLISGGDFTTPPSRN